jgi:hypothetical protein
MQGSAPTSADFVRALGYPLQLVALHPATGRVEVRHATDAVSLAQAVRQMQKLNAEGLNDYYEVNPGARGRRSKAGDITHLRAIVGDADATDGRSVQDCFAAAAALALPPTFTLATGGGVQVVYLLDEVTLATTENAAIYEAVGRAIRDLIDGDAVFDLPRIMRLPGFTNWPNAKKRAAGREPAKAKVLAASARRYSLGELAHAFVKAPTAGTTTARANVNADLSGGLAAPPWFNTLSPDDQNACLAEMLHLPNVVALADTSDGAPAPNWRTIMAACARSGAPDAYNLCRAWAQTSPRFDPRDFDTRYRSYCHD